jgi:hypothetical protein
MARWRSRHLGATLSAVGLIWMVAAGGAAAGNNGTLKIHEAGTPTGTPNNDPKVGCGFDIEGFGLDAGQTGHLVFTVQGGDAPTGVDEDGGDVGANASGYFIAGPYDLASGHYKATLYGKDGDGDVKAKSKVFKVTCDGGGGGGGGGVGSNDPEN